MVNYKMKKMIIFFFAAITPLLMMMIMFYLGFPILGATLISILIGFALAFTGNVITSQPAFIKAFEGEGILAFDFNSSGITRLFTVQVQVPDIAIKTKDGIEKRLYDRTISLIMREPEKAGIYEKDNVNEKTGEATRDLVFTMGREKYQQSLFKAGYLNFLLFNSQTGMFVTKEQLATMEKNLMVEYVTLNEWREIRELSKIIRDFTRTTMDSIMNKLSLGALFNNPIVKIIAVILAVVIIGAIIVQVLPQFGIDILPQATKAAVTNTGAVTSPLANQSANIIK